MHWYRSSGREFIRHPVATSKAPVSANRLTDGLLTVSPREEITLAPPGATHTSKEGYRISVPACGVRRVSGGDRAGGAAECDLALLSSQGWIEIFTPLGGVR